MADRRLKLALNADGQFYVDETCIYCNQCWQTAPDNFAEDPVTGLSYVYQQPRNELEADLCVQAMDNCPTCSIGGDGGEDTNAAD